MNGNAEGVHNAEGGDSGRATGSEVLCKLHELLKEGLELRTLGDLSFKLEMLFIVCFGCPVVRVHGSCLLQDSLDQTTKNNSWSTTLKLPGRYALKCIFFEISAFQDKMLRILL